MSGLEDKIQEARSVLKKAFEKHGEDLAFAWTGNKDSTTLIHIAKELRGGVDFTVFFIDNGLYPEASYKFMSEVEKMWGFDLVRFPVKNMLKYKLARTKKKKSKIAAELKIQGLKKAIERYKWKALVVAIRKDEHSARENERFFSKRNKHERVHPILNFSEEDIWEYIRLNKIPYHPYYDLGYRSIGEKDLTKPVESSEKERSGRDQYKEDVMKRLRSLGYF